MKIIEKLMSLIEDELDDAEKYAHCALKFGDEYPELRSVFRNLSHEEMGHKEMLHAQVVKLIEKHRLEHGDPPVAMLAVYEHLHERAIERAARVRALQDELR